MCLIFLAVGQHRKYPLIVVANRDEFLNRPAAPANFWKSYPDVLGGQDLASPTEPPGTWMGIHRDGRIAMITNYRDLKNINPNAPSRGLLVSSYLTKDQETGESYLQRIAQYNPGQYNGFNLIAGTNDALWWYSNRGQEIARLQPGIHGLSNHLLNTPWPKVQRGKSVLSTLLESDDPKLETFFDMMIDPMVFPDEQLPDTGVGPAMERSLSASFIRMPGYGTRCTTVIAISDCNEANFLERIYKPDGGIEHESRFQLELTHHD